jgi:tRNA-binding protein
MATIEDFDKLEIRCGQIIEVLDFPEAKKPAFKLMIDFGAEIGIKNSCAQLTKNYTKEDLLGKFIAAVTNFPPRKIGPAISEVLVLGFPDNEGKAILVSPDKNVELGVRLF